MTDIVTEIVTEIVSEVAAELEAPDAAPGDAAEAAEQPDQAPEAETPAAAHEFAYVPGSTSQLVVDHMLDSEGDQSIAQIIAGLGTVSRNTVEGAVRRLHEAGRLLRVLPGVYRLAPPAAAKRPQPAVPLEPAEPPAPAAPQPDLEEARLEADRERKRLARERDREAALARQAEADARLRGKLILATGGNYVGGPDLHDVSAIKAAMELVPLNVVTEAIASQCERGIYKLNEPA